MNPREIAARALLLIPLLPVACSSGDESQADRDPIYSGGRAGQGNGGNQGYGGVMGNGAGAAGGAFGQGGANGASGANGAGPGGGSGMGGGGGLGGSGGMAGGGIGATGGIAGNSGTSGAAGAGNVSGNAGTAGTGGGGREPIIPPVMGTCPNLTTGTISVTRGSRTLGGIRVEAGAGSPTAPLVFYWHGTGGQATEYSTQARAVRDGVIQEGGILVSFQGTTGGDLLSGTSIFGAGDFEIADQIVACAVQEKKVDPKRIFATGCSAGGLFSGAMGVMRANYMAAIAPNSGGLLAPGMWQNANTPALMTIHGAMGRDVVIVDFATTSKTADDAYKNHGGFVVNCDHGGGHCGGSGHAPSIWTFFKAHPYGAGKPWSSLPSGFHTSCRIY